MGINITIELTHTPGLSPEGLRKLEADLASALDDTVQSYWLNARPQVSIDYFDDEPPKPRALRPVIRVRCHLNGSHAPGFTDQKVYAATGCSEGAYWSIRDDLNIERIIALDSPCPHLWSIVPTEGNLVAKVMTGYWTREPEAA